MIISTITIWHWLGFAALLCILEVVLGASLFLLWLAASALIVALVLIFLPEIGWQYQLLLFSVQSTICLMFWYSRVKKSLHTTQSTLNRRSEQYINRVFTLTEAIVNGRGKIQVDDTFWLVEGQDLAVGTRVRVTGVQGVILQVEKL